MTEKQLTGITIVCTPNLPVEIVNEKTNGLETFHMIQNRNTLFVSEELGNALHEELKKLKEENKQLNHNLDLYEEK